MIARPLDNPALDRRLVALRTSSGNTVIYKRKALARVLTAIRDGDIVAILIDQNVQEGTASSCASSASPLHDDGGGGARAEDGLRHRARALPAAAERPLPHGLRPARRVEGDGPPRRGRGGPHAAPHRDHRRLGARDSGAVAMAPPAVEDESIPRDVPRPGPEGSAGTGICGSHVARLERCFSGRRGALVTDPSSQGTAGLLGAARVLVRAPNWVGDVVLSLPALRDVRRCLPDARLEVLARPWVAELYRAVPGVDAVVESRGPSADVDAVRGGFDLGLLLPNSFGTALVLWRAAVRSGGAMRRTAAACC